MEEHSGTSSVADSAVGSKQLTFTLKKVNPHKVENICFSLVFQMRSVLFRTKLIQALNIKYYSKLSHNVCLS